MCETQPYVEKISVEFWPFLDFLTSDNRGVGPAHARTHTNTQSISTFTICFSLKLGGVIKGPGQCLGLIRILLKLKHSQAHKRSLPHTFADTHSAA